MTKDKRGIWREHVKDPTAKSGWRWLSSKSRKTLAQKVKDWYANETVVGVKTSRVAAEWWDDIEPTLAVNTAHGYRPSRDRAILYLPTYIGDVTAQDVSLALQRFIKTNHPAQKTVTNLLQVIRQICQFAVVRGYIKTNPAREVKIPRGLEKKKVTMPSTEDIQIVKDTKDTEIGRFCFWALYTGMRRGELLALEWKDVDVKNRVIYVTKSVYHEGNQPHIKEPKTKAGRRVVPIVDKLLPEIHKKKSGRVFPMNEAGGIMTAAAWNKRWAKYQRETGIGCTPHQLRHAYATMLYEAGIAPRDAMSVLGHAQYSTTMDVYTDIRKEREKSTFETLSKIDL